MKATEWKLDDQIKTKADIVMFLMCAVGDIKIPHAPTQKDMRWLAIACNDYLRIAKQRGWIE